MSNDWKAVINEKEWMWKVEMVSSYSTKDDEGIHENLLQPVFEVGTPWIQKLLDIFRRVRKIAESEY